MADYATNWKPGAGFDKLRQRTRRGLASTSSGSVLAGGWLRQAQAACSPAASTLAELVEASEDTAPPTVHTLAAQGLNGQAGLNHALRN